MGYTPVPTASAEEALTSLERLDELPALLVTALTLSGIGGGELADRLQASVPGLDVLFLTGYALEGDDDLKDVTGGRRLLQKPFSVESLIQAVRLVRGDS